MNEDQFNQRVRSIRGRSRNSRTWTGIFLLAIGGILFAQNAGVFFPPWVFSWPMLLIVIGLFSGIKHGFRRGPWFVLLIIGGIFLSDKVSDDIFLRPYFWPLMFVAAGAYFIIGNNRKHNEEPPYGNDGGSEPAYTSGDKTYPTETSNSWSNANNSKDDTVDVSAVFSGVKRNIISKQFKGGNILALMGGVELNFMKAELDGKVAIDNFTMFGGTKLIVPPDWNVQSNVVALFGGVDDKRPPAMAHDPAKVLFLEGTCVFGGIEVRSY